MFSFGQNLTKYTPAFPTTCFTFCFFCLTAHTNRFSEDLTGTDNSPLGQMTLSNLSDPCFSVSISVLFFNFLFIFIKQGNILTLGQHGFELLGSIYRWSFLQYIESVLQGVQLSGDYWTAQSRYSKFIFSALFFSTFSFLQLMVVQEYNIYPHDFTYMDSKKIKLKKTHKHKEQ